VLNDFSGNKVLPHIAFLHAIFVVVKIQILSKRIPTKTKRKRFMEEKMEEFAVADTAVVSGGTVIKDTEAPKSGKKDKKETKRTTSSYAKHGFKYGCYRFVKRTFDIVSSGLLFIVVSPLILICLLIKLLEDINKKYCKLEITEVEDDGKKHKNWYKSKNGKLYECKVVKDSEKKHKGKRAPVYSSVRVGKDGKEFKFFKIRSMYPGAEAMKEQLIEAGLNEADEPAFKMKNDPRITPFGRVLRKLSIDELLQLLNIFAGSMSVVGPRPPLPDEVKEYTPYQLHRLDVKGGLLCLWQVQKNKNDLSFDEWVDLDVRYIKGQSIWLDIKIIFTAIKLILTRGGYNSQYFTRKRKRQRRR